MCEALASLSQSEACTPFCPAQLHEMFPVTLRLPYLWWLGLRKSTFEREKRGRRAGGLAHDISVR
jgi:hypothetical protein